MRFVIYGAGGVGGTIGARLHMAGFEVCLIARGAHGQALQQHGLHFIAPDYAGHLPIPTVTHPDQLTLAGSDCVVLMCMKSQHTQGACEDLSRHAPLDTPIVCVQNGVTNEMVAQRFFRRVYASVVLLPGTHLQAGQVVTHAEGHGGILDTGCYPHGVDPICEEVTSALRAANFSAHPDASVMRQKYAKLLMNLGNVLQAGLVQGADVRSVARLLRREALACYAAAGIDCASVEETKTRRHGVMRTVEIDGVPRGGGSSWQSVTRGTGNIETDYLNGEMCRIGRAHGVATPANDACVVMARDLMSGRLAPTSLSIEQFQARIEALSSSRTAT